MHDNNYNKILQNNRITLLFARYLELKILILKGQMTIRYLEFLEKFSRIVTRIEE